MSGFRCDFSRFGYAERSAPAQTQPNPFHLPDLDQTSLGSLDHFSDATAHRQ